MTHIIPIVVLDDTILGSLDLWQKSISPPCKGGWGDFKTVSFRTTNRITQLSFPRNLSSRKRGAGIHLGAITESTSEHTLRSAAFLSSGEFDFVVHIIRKKQRLAALPS
jgi:hypothetical protein